MRNGASPPNPRSHPSSAALSPGHSSNPAGVCATFVESSPVVRGSVRVRPECNPSLVGPGEVLPVKETGHSYDCVIGQVRYREILSRRP